MTDQPMAIRPVSAVEVDGEPFFRRPQLVQPRPQQVIRVECQPCGLLLAELVGGKIRFVAEDGPPIRIGGGRVVCPECGGQVVVTS